MRSNARISWESLSWSTTRKDTAKIAVFMVLQLFTISDTCHRGRSAPLDKVYNELRHTEACNYKTILLFLTYRQQKGQLWSSGIYIKYNDGL